MTYRSLLEQTTELALENRLVAGALQVLVLVVLLVVLAGGALVLPVVPTHTADDDDERGGDDGHTDTADSEDDAKRRVPLSFLGIERRGSGFTVGWFIVGDAMTLHIR